MTKAATEIVGTDGQLPVEDWLRQVSGGRSLSRSTHDVLQAAISNPEIASYASAADLAKVAGVNVATVTRAAQAIGFSGWPDLRQEIRARYLGTLSAPEVATVHGSRSTGRPFDDALSRHIEALNAIRKTLDRRAVQHFARAMAAADRRLIVASGSFVAVAKVLAHNASLAGYRCDLLDDPATVANAIADLGPSDVLVAVTFWRLFNATITAARQARARGATVCVLSDRAKSPMADLAHHLLVVPAEGTSFFPSPVPGLAVVDGLCAELGTLDAARTARSIAAAEAQWQAFDLLHFNARERSREDG